ncbi:MAG: phenylalanine--tRNA ligase subunit beta, partial [Bacteroidota bacterium]|nr:phenylalanine--tRNA ligase subunit beta [Bacteroidota bacterium]
IIGDKIIVKTLLSGSTFVTLDGVERELNENDLMICNTQEGMCIGGVFGGIKSGVKDTTTDIFLESAWFNPVYIRKTSRRHGLHTDASFHFERGVDPNTILYSLKRAALLIKETAGGTISSEIVDVCPNPDLMNNFPVFVSYANTDRLIGEKLPHEVIKNILASLEIKIIAETAEGLDLEVPPYRVDVQREADVIEDILRVYGYNNIIPDLKVRSTIQYSSRPDRRKMQNLVSERLTANGFNEVMNNSLTKAAYYENLKSYSAENTVKIFNPLSSDLNAMRQSLLFGGLETIQRNTKFKNADLRLYEFGNVYTYNGPKDQQNPANNYAEEAHLALFISGNRQTANWTTKEQPSSFFELKSYTENILKWLGINPNQLRSAGITSDLFAEGLLLTTAKGKVIAEFGIVSPKLTKRFDLSRPVYFADLNWDNVLCESQRNVVTYSELPRFPEVRRDLALLLDHNVSFNQIKEVAFKTERKLLRQVDLFDVYEGKNLPEGKKSYAVSYILRDDERTLEDKQIDKMMQRLIQAYDRELGAQIR